MATDLLLEHVHKTVTLPVNEYGDTFEAARHRCRAWFCKRCCEKMGYDLRKRLFPILETFSELLLVTFTIDPRLFSDEKSAYFYLRKRRCIARTLQDLFRWGYLNSRRYFYVIEWQKNEQVHFHVLLDARFIPIDKLRESWSKHRPKDAGSVEGNRPAFGFVWISKPHFSGGPRHAARYVTKYLIKVPEHGFPQWVLQLGKHTRIKRYSTSRRFWKNVTHRSQDSTSERERTGRTYAERVAGCGSSVDLFQIRETINPETDERHAKRTWIGELHADADTVMKNLFDPGDPRRSRRTLMARSVSHAHRIINAAAGHETAWIRGGPCIPKKLKRMVDELEDELDPWKTPHTWN